MSNLVSNVIDTLEVLSEGHPMISTESSDVIPSNPGISNDEGEPVLLMHPFVRSLLIDDANHEDKVEKRIVLATSSFDIPKSVLQYSCQKEEDHKANLRDLEDHDRVDELTRVEKRELLDNDGNNNLDTTEEMKYVVAGTISSSSDMNMNSQSLPCVIGNECLNHSGEDLFVSSPDKQNGSTAEDEELIAVPEKEGDEEQKKRNSSTSSTTSVRWITHYNSSQKILLAGEGDFSFAACLAHAFGSASNMVATSLDSKVTLDRRLPSSKLHIFDLRRLGCLVLHEIDVHFMASANSKVVNMKFDRIIYNFPHAGHWRKLREEDFELIWRHQVLLSGFFKSSRKLLREDGEVHVAHRDDYPYNTWDIEELAKKAGLFLIEKVKFRPENYPSYSNKRGSRIKSWDSFGFGDFPMTFKFSPVKKNKTY